MVRTSYLRQILVSFCSLEKFENNSEFPQGPSSLVSGPYFIFFMPVMEPLNMMLGLVPVIVVLVLNPAGIYMLKVNNKNTRTRCEICSELTIKTPE